MYFFQFGFGGNNPATSLLGNKAPGIGQVGGLASGVVNTAADVGGRLAESLKGLIESKFLFQTMRVWYFACWR